MSPFNEWMDLRVETVEPEMVTLAVPGDRRFTNPDGMVHGGILSALVDVAARAALVTALDDPLETTLATTDVTIRYLRPADGPLRAIGHVQRAGGSSGIASVDIRCVDGEESAKAAPGSASHRFM